MYLVQFVLLVDAELNERSDRQRGLRGEKESGVKSGEEDHDQTDRP